MSHSRQVLAMLNSRAEGDEEMFYSVALQIAAAEARCGHQSTAEDIRTAVDRARETDQNGYSKPAQIHAPRGDLAGILELRQARFRFSDVVLMAAKRQRLDRIVREQLQRDRLRSHGMLPSRRLLFVGMPGTGKTMTAEAISEHLKVPLYVIRLESLFSRYLGETTAKLRLVFDECCRRRGVYLFDEFDSLGGNRTGSNDVGELRRVLNAFLQFVEESNSTDSLVIAATNHSWLLDPALLRRFDLVLRFDPPTTAQIRELVELHTLSVPLAQAQWDRVAAAAKDLSQSEVVLAVMDTVKAAIIEERTCIGNEELIVGLHERRAMAKVFHQDCALDQGE